MVWIHIGILQRTPHHITLPRCAPYVLLMSFVIYSEMAPFLLLRWLRRRRGGSGGGSVSTISMT